MQTTPEPDEFAGIATSAECVLVADKLFGRDLARFMVENVSPDRRSLQKMARELKAGGATDLAKMVAEVARTVPLDPRRSSFKQRWRRQLKRSKCA
jgi:hypothetical protein